jgi:hypothetical protein
MGTYKITFDFNIEVDCEEEDIKDQVTMWWSECIDVPDYDVTEIGEEE